MNIETYISLGLSVLAAIGASYTYVVHTRRLNSQQKQITDYQLKHLKEEEDEKKKEHLGRSDHRHFYFPGYRTDPYNPCLGGN